MELVWLEDYLALAESLNFSRAAEARHVTQPAFSRRIRALEAWVGTPLFTRTTHQVALTPAGVHFQAQAEMLCRALHQLRRDTLEVAGRKAGLLTIAATHALSFSFFPQWMRRHDHIMALGTFNLVSDSMERCEQMMLRGDVHFLLCHDHPRMDSPLSRGAFKSIVVGSDKLLPLSIANADGRPRWPIDGGQPVKYLAYSARSGLGRIIAAQWHGDRYPAVETVFTSHLAATLLSMVRAGDGMAWLPRTLVEEDLMAGRLVLAGPADLILPIEIRLFRPSARQGQTAEALWAALAQC